MMLCPTCPTHPTPRLLPPAPQSLRPLAVCPIPDPALPVSAPCVGPEAEAVQVPILATSLCLEGRAARGCEGIVGFVVLSIFAIMWVVLAGLTTFRGPFLTTGNGYFSSWIGAACACFAAFASRRKSKAEALAKSKKNQDAKPGAEWAEEDDSPV